MTKVEYLDQVMASFKGTSILGAASGQLCETGHKNNGGFTVVKTDDVRDSTTVSTTKTTGQGIR